MFIYRLPPHHERGGWLKAQLAHLPGLGGELSNVRSQVGDGAAPS